MVCDQVVINEYYTIQYVLEPNFSAKPNVMSFNILRIMIGAVI